MKLNKKAPSWANVAAGSDVTLEIPIKDPRSPSIDRIGIGYAGVTLAQLTNIEVELDGKVIQRYATGTELDELNQYYGRGAAATNSILSIHFLRPELANLIHQRICTLGVADKKTLHVKMKIDAAAVAPVLTANLKRSAAQPTGTICKIKSFPRDFATSGAQEIDNLPVSPHGIIAMHLYKADISNVDLELDSFNAVEATKSILEDDQAAAGRTPVTAKATHLDFCLDGDLDNALMLKHIGDMRVRPTIDTSGLVNIVVEYLDTYAGI